MLRWRLLLGSLFVIVLAILFWVDLTVGRPGIVMFPLAALLAPVGAGEMLRMYRERGGLPSAWVFYVGTTLVVAFSGIPYLWPGYPDPCPLGPLGWPLLGLTLGMLLAFVAEMLGYDQSESSSDTNHGATHNIAEAMLAMVYVGVLLSFLIQLRFVGGSVAGGLPLISLLVVVKLSDIGQYTVGRLIGRHKLAPRLSPGKTIEGFVGGLVFAVAGAWISFAWLAAWVGAAELARPAILHLVIYGLLLATAGVLGDLAESLLKRVAGVKDSSAWLPGFGGLLDLLDSLLAAAPVAYVWWLLWGDGLGI